MRIWNQSNPSCVAGDRQDAERSVIAQVRGERMINSRESNPTIQAVFDILCGFAAFFIVLLVSFITREQQDIRSFLVAVCVAFFVVGYLRARGRSGRVTLRFLFIVIGGIAPAIALKELRIALTAPPFLQMYVILGSLAAAVGMTTRWLVGKARLGIVRP